MEFFLRRGIEKVSQIGGAQDILVCLEKEGIEVSDLEQKKRRTRRKDSFEDLLRWGGGSPGGQWRRAAHLVLGHVEEIDCVAPGSKSRPSLGHVLTGRAHGSVTSRTRSVPERCRLEHSSEGTAGNKQPTGGGAPREDWLTIDLGLFTHAISCPS